MYNTYPSDYTTYDHVDDQLKALTTGASLDNDLATIVIYIHEASQLINAWCGRTFVPYISTSESVRYAISRSRYQQLPDDTLSLTSITDTSGTTVLASSYKLLNELYQANGSPYRYIEIASSASISYADSSDFHPSFTVDGIFGYSQQPYANAWVNTTTMNNDGNLSASATSLVVTASTNIETLDYIRIEDEFMQVTTIDSATETLTLKRGVNGSTATTHDDSTQIDVWQVNHAIKLATTRLTAWLYSSRQNETQAIQFQDGTVAGVNYPQIVQQSIAQYIKPIAESV